MSTYDSSLTGQLRSDRARLELLEAFDARYPGLPGRAYTFNASLNINVLYNAAEERDRTLAKVGEILGRSGWTKKASDSQPFCFRYKRVIDGVTILIEGAESLPAVEGEIPVPPSAFPILLEDTQSAEGK